MEIWKDIKSYEGLYKVSNCGNVYSIKSNKNLSLVKTNKGYLTVNLSKNGNKKKYFVHVLVAITFIKNTNKRKTQVNHIDGNKENNNISNLEWVSPSRNMEHATQNGLNNVQARFGKKVKCIETNEEFESVASASRKFKIDKRNIVNSCNGTTKNTNGLHFEWI